MKIGCDKNRSTIQNRNVRTGQLGITKQDRKAKSGQPVWTVSLGQDYQKKTTTVDRGTSSERTAKILKLGQGRHTVQDR
jgi:hypothetical protein